MMSGEEATDESPGRGGWEPPGRSPQPRPDLGESPELVERLMRLGRMLSDPLGARIIATLLTVGECSPGVTAKILGESQGNVLHAFKRLMIDGAIEPRAGLAERPPADSLASLIPSLHASLRAIVQELGPSTERAPEEEGTQRRTWPRQPQQPAPRSLLASVGQSYYLLLRARGDRLGEHSESLVEVGKALAHPLRVEILVYLIVRGQGSNARIADDLKVKRNLVGRHTRHLAQVYAVRSVVGQPGEWEITEPMRSGLGGFYDYLMIVRELDAAALRLTESADPSPDGESETKTTCNGNESRS